MISLEHALVAIGVIAFFFALVWRQRRSDRWQTAGRCYQCGAALGFDSKAVTLRFKAPTAPKNANFCGRCASHRRLWSYLVGAMVAVFCFIVWLAMRNSGFASQMGGV